MEKEKNHFLILDLAPTTKAVGSIGLIGEYLAPTTKAVGSDFVKCFEPTASVVGLQKTSYSKYF